MRKFKIFWDFDAEECYLNEMASKGHILKNYSDFGVYHFIDGEPQNLNYKIDYRILKSTHEFQNYITLFEDAGWKHICGTKWNGSQYFLPINDQAGTEIFSDRISAAMRYKTLYAICRANVFVFLCYLIVVFLSYDRDLSQLGFLTPGLWERTGMAFWSGFFFELPFVILRVGFPVIFAVIGILYGYWGMKAKRAYETKIEEEN